MAYIPTIKKESAWRFETADVGGLGLGVVVTEGGMLFLTDPGGQYTSFKYGAAGVGAAVGYKLPKIGKLQLKGRGVGVVAAPPFFSSKGKLYVLDSFKGNELTRSDIQGTCAFVEGGLGYVAGGSATVLLVGMNPVFLAASIVTLPLPPAQAFFK